MVDDEEQEELRCTGSDVEIEEYTDTEDSPYVAYQATDKLFDTDRATWQKFSFIATLLTVVVSITFLIITYPLYLESVSYVSNAYTGLLFTAFFSAFILGIVSFIWGRIYPPPALIPNSLRIKIPRCALLKISLIYAFSGIVITLSMDRDRVLCHLQDPIKGITLVFSLVYYFFFCRKMMSLQRIFSSTTIIVGLFISVDYGLCDEFRCRGREVSAHVTTVKGTWGVKAIWTFVYVGALAAFAMFFTLLEGHYTTEQQNMCQIMASQQNSFLYTVSRLVSSRDIRRRGSEEEGGRLLHVTDPDPTVKPKHIPKPPILETLFYIHLIALFAILSMCWIDTLPGIGRGLSPVELYRTVENGFTCHFNNSEACSNISTHGWIFLIAYIVFSISALNFLSMCESAVFTVAAATVSLPLSGIWWSIYKMDVHGGFITWSPGVTGELICALLGLPVVLLGLGLLVRSHFRDTQSYYLTMQPPNVQCESCQR
ncbi:uncharacterized protein LOC107996417 [Apis cerana]|uniref:uncharacterized protein LOC107996417 n=1 Tax=Apis cerana TaxID=7461 RepID=UPI0007E2DD9C|nr:uncharacterized protein LOC107996417 [Apis cerana]XP_016909939.1 uncharacterized protein LOC107996417 [Apis cerana]XP_016909940.1 uncharacterized protein LOC107996417 [Apis cerana]XP_028521808.1 uncharacterized protein LOC107996417 [Apis cerana]XP_028521809.1 uncharacterized protein LOC107996417 [Apis cerana]XP_028521810.1 uncharacterized protein LOC107996417 [Apis cerana]XP_061934683.1 uncharacterized protein LOC107996417 [Apis cerana]XP_061934684.1 uncharacterized protein LOC107996417 [